MTGWTVERVPAEKEGASSGDGSWSAEELERREAAAGIRAGSVMMCSPDGSADPILTLFFNSRAFAGLAASTQASYLTDYRLFFNFLYSRDRSWDQARAQDLEDYEDWRRRAPENTRRIGGSKFMRELAALSRLYSWALDSGRAAINPVLSVSRTNNSGRLVARLKAAPHDRVGSDVRWLTPRAWQRWRDVGLVGLDPAGVPDPTFRGRSGDRNAAYADLLFDSGLRRTEGGSLLTLEVPKIEEARRYQTGRVARAVCKNSSGRPFYVTTSTVRQIEAYRLTTRSAMVLRAQGKGSYDAVRGLLLLEEMIGNRSPVVRWRDRESGERGEAPLDRLEPTLRARLFRRTEHGLEPLWLWLNEQGLPFAPHSWNAVFSAATSRCHAVIGEGAPFCTPHMARHSFALSMLIALHHVMDVRFGLTPQQRRDFTILYGDPWRLVKELLGHQSEATTREIYLAPVAHVHVRSLLEGDLSERSVFLHEVAAASGLVQDVAQ